MTIKSPANNGRKILPRDPFERYDLPINSSFIAKVVFRYIRGNTSLPVLRNIAVTEDLVRLVNDLEHEAIALRETTGSLSKVEGHELKGLALEQVTNEEGQAMKRVGDSLKAKYKDRLVRFDEQLIAEIHEAIESECGTQVIDEMERDVDYLETPTKSQDYFRLASHQCASGYHLEAVKNFKIALAIGDNRNEIAHSLASCLFYHLHDPETALSTIETGVFYELSESNELLRNRQLKAEILFSLGRTDEALEIVKTDLEHMKQLISKASWDERGEGNIENRVHVSGPNILMFLTGYKRLCQRLQSSPIANRRAIKRTKQMEKEIGKAVQLF
jgi:tetratricopeptide (TPR) repeat protein